MPTREQFLARFSSESDALSFEQYVLSAGREYLSPAEVAVLDGDEPTPEYWAAMIGALDDVEDLDRCGQVQS